jgi:hypothetical protein
LFKLKQSLKSMHEDGTAEKILHKSSMRSNILSSLEN